MSDNLDDLDALFEEISAQNQGQADVSPAPQAQQVAPAGASVGNVVSASASASVPVAASVGAAASAATATPHEAGQIAAESDESDESDKPMFERLGGIVRLLHDSLRELGYDRSLTDVASQISDAQGRLEYVATLTEQAANKVLNAIDEGMPAQDELSRNAKDMEARWADLFAGKLGVDDFKILAADSQRFAAATAQAAEVEKARMLEIMMAQDFQDITGQLIKKIVGITSVAERELAQLLRDHAPAEHKAAVQAGNSGEQSNDLMAGPGMPGAAMAQDDVDDLLGSLGF